LIQGLDNINYENPAAKAAMINACEAALAPLQVDAMRIDAVKSLSPLITHEIELVTGLKSIGECYHGDPAYISQWITQRGQKGEWGLMDFPLYFAIRNNFARGKPFVRGFGAGEFDVTVPEIFAQDWRYGGNANHMSTFLDNHDLNRFMTEADNSVARLQQALIFIFTVRGQPIVFQGTEQEKGNDGNELLKGSYVDTTNRWSMFSHDEDGSCVPTHFDTNKSTYQLIKRLNAFHDQLPALAIGNQLEMWQSQWHYAFSRMIDTKTTTGGEGDARISSEVIVIFSTASNLTSLDIPIRCESSLAVGTVLINAWDPGADRIVIIKGGVTGRQIRVSLWANSNKIYHH
jgi:glycosidase